jgi:hypothetical protein
MFLLTRRFLSLARLPLWVACGLLALAAALVSVAQAQSRPAAVAKDAPPAASGEVAFRIVTYPTRPPRPFTLLYRLQRGGLQGSGELAWRPTGDSYEASLKGTVAGITLLNWGSTGRIDKTGLAPEHYSEHRLGKSTRDTRFERGESKIVFESGGDVPWVAGAQDRLSWMVQLPAILAADPAKTKMGTRIGLFVVGVRGRAETWVFQASGNESVSTPAGNVRAVKWVRELRRPQDARVEVWVDPARQYLPVRVRLGLQGSDSPLELTLADAGS